jgi:hypothetical protein
MDQWRALANMLINHQVSENAEFLSSCATAVFSRTQLHGVIINMYSNWLRAG